MGKACEIAKKEMKNDEIHLKKLYKKMLTKVKEIPYAWLNGDENQRFWGNLNLTFKYADGEKLIMALKKFAISASSACSSESFDPSYVLKAIQLSDEDAFCSLRIGIGRFTTEA